MMIRSLFSYLSSQDSQTPTGVWNWAKRLVDALDKLRVTIVMQWFAGLNLAGQVGKVLIVNTGETGLEFATVSSGGATLIVDGGDASNTGTPYIALDGGTA